MRMYMCLGHLLCHSGITFMRGMRRVQTEELVEVQCEKGAQGAEQGVVLSGPPALSAQSWHSMLTQSRGQTSSLLFSKKERGEEILG
ncbi:hypothetical protein CesoFtcFv8_000919 [Champsocephalus esox]|uniref:Uncharacterized protein n=1 Tax=Champsocephalus esox TaxID=159716 RepID=A0AAN8D4R7_9TELE|nr:hypothetical protein CesoFtcFv8_000919 [Champsocephalus esox]